MRDRGAARDDRLGVLLGDRRADVIGIVGGVGDDRLGRRILQQASRLRGIAGLAGGEHEADRAAEPSHGEVDLGGQAATRASDRLIASPPFAPLACW